MLFHGTPLTPDVWDETEVGLRRYGSVLCPDLSAVEDGSNPQRELAASVASGLAGDDAKWHVVGHSFGGQVAMEFALAVPERTATLTIVCSRDTPFPAFTDVAHNLRANGVTSGLVDAALDRWLTAEDMIAGPGLVAYVRRCLQRTDAQAWANALAGIASYDRSAEMPRLTMPVSLIAAEFDVVSMPSAMRDMASRLPQSRRTFSLAQLT